MLYSYLWLSALLLFKRGEVQLISMTRRDRGCLVCIRKSRTRNTLNVAASALRRSSIVAPHLIARASPSRFIGITSTKLSKFGSERSKCHVSITARSTSLQQLEICRYIVSHHLQLSAPSDHSNKLHLTISPFAALRFVQHTPILRCETLCRESLTRPGILA